MKSKISNNFIIIVVSICLGCCEYELSDTPICLEKNINYINRYSGHCAATIIEYEFQNKLVYFIDPGTCAYDEEYPIINSNYDTLSNLAGAAGNAIINGEDFYKSAKIKRIVWIN